MGICRFPHTAWRTLADETVVIDLKRKTMVGLNPAGGQIWEMLDRPRTFEELQQKMSDSWSEPVLREFCEQLVTLGLAELSPHLTRTDTERDSSTPVSHVLDQPAVLWTEAIQQAAGTCAFLPGEGALCTQAPFN